MTLATHPFLKATLVEGPLALVMAEEVCSVRGCVTSDRGERCALATLDRRWVEDGLVPQPLPSELDRGDSFLRAPGTAPDPVRARRCRCNARVLRGGTDACLAGRVPVLLLSDQFCFWQVVLVLVSWAVCLQVLLFLCDRASRAVSCTRSLVWAGWRFSNAQLKFFYRSNKLLAIIYFFLI